MQFWSADWQSWAAICNASPDKSNTGPHIDMIFVVQHTLDNRGTPIKPAVHLTPEGSVMDATGPGYCVTTDIGITYLQCYLENLRQRQHDPFYYLSVFILHYEIQVADCLGQHFWVLFTTSNTYLLNVEHDAVLTSWPYFYVAPASLCYGPILESDFIFKFDISL